MIVRGNTNNIRVHDKIRLDSSQVFGVKKSASFVTFLILPSNFFQVQSSGSDDSIQIKNVIKVPITDMKYVIQVWMYETWINLLEPVQFKPLICESFVTGPNVQLPNIGVITIAG